MEDTSAQVVEEAVNVRDVASSKSSIKPIREAHSSEKAAPQFQYDARLADPEKSKELIANVREAVFEEYDRAPLEGTATKEQVDLNKKHVEQVAKIVKEGVAALREGKYSGEEINVTDEQLNLTLIEAYGHDVQKITPERTPLDLSAEIGALTVIKTNLQERTSSLGDSEELSGRLREIVSEIKDLRAQEKAHSGEEPWKTYLVMHGEDSASWTRQQLEDMGFNKEVRDKVAEDIVTHMGMPYVRARLFEMQKESQRRPDKKIILPEQLEYGELPEPKTVEGAILFAADLLSPRELAGKDIAKDPAAGCFDRYVSINLNIYDSNGLPNGLEDAVLGDGGAYKSLKDNVIRLQNPPRVGSRPVAARVEKIIGDVLGAEALRNADAFIGAVNRGIEIGGQEYKGFKSLNKYHQVGMPDGSQVDVIDARVTMEMYYKAVDAYRKKLEAEGGIRNVIV